MQPNYDDQPVLQDIKQLLGYSLEHFLQPISAEQPSGISLRHNGVYTAIKEARRQDDSSLPQGVWSHELKKANWQQVTQITVDALIQKSKDLQLIVWLLEAQVHQYGFRGIAPCIRLMHTLCEAYWEDIYPHIENDDLEYRTNTISWINEKLLPVLRLIPITSTGEETGDASWADREMAIRSEQIKASRKNKNENTPADPGLDVLQRAINATPTDFYIEISHDLNFALQTILDFVSFLDHSCGEQAPSMQTIINLLDDIRLFIENELDKRGVRFADQPDDQQGYQDEGYESIDSREYHHAAAHNRHSTNFKTDIDNMTAGVQAAYATLEKIAAYLQEVNPHSPVPYLITRGVQWGKMNTAELYHEIFVKYQGKISIFDILGLPQEGRSANN